MIALNNSNARCKHAGCLHKNIGGSNYCWQHYAELFREAGV